jgi:hypothetical protein
MENKFRRELGAMENLFASYCEIASMNFAVAARVTGQVRLDELKQAVYKVQSLHPILSVGIVKTDHGRYFEATDQLPDVVFHYGTTWSHIAASDTAKPFDAIHGALVRVSVLVEDEAFYLIVTMHHAIADGMTATFFIRDILSVLSGSLPERTSGTSLDDYLGSHLKAFVDNGTPQAGEERQDNSPWAYRPYEPPNVVILEFDQIATDNFVSAARQNNVTVHAALTSAIAQAWREHQNAATDVKVFSPINARNLSDDGPQYGLFISAGTVSCAPLSFWDEARKAHQDLAPFRTLESAVVVSGFARLALLKNASSSAAESFFRNHSMYDVMLTNLGKSDIPGEYGKYRISELWGPMLRCGLKNEIVFGAVTFEGSLRITCTSMERSGDIMNSIRDILNGVVAKSV